MVDETLGARLYKREYVYLIPRYEGAPPATESLILLCGKSDKAIQCLYREHTAEAGRAHPYYQEW
jgi:hypothetical protein